MPRLLILCLALPLAGAGFAASPALVYDQPATYDVAFGFTLESGLPLPERVEAWLPVPLERPGQQISGLKASPPPSRSWPLPACRYWRFEAVAASPVSASLSFELTAWRIHLDPAHYRARAYKTNSKLYRDWTASSQHIDLSDPWVVGQAETLRVRHPDPLDRARAAYDLVLDHLEYVRIHRFGGSRYAARERHGECGDYSALFAALCRRSGIPARPVVGYWANELDEAHVWAEFYLEGVGWVPCDPSQGDLVDREQFFGRLDNMRVVLSEGVDLPLPFDFPPGTASIFQTGAYWLKGGSGVVITPRLVARKR